MQDYSMILPLPRLEMQPLNDMPYEIANSIVAVLVDIDDTLTTDGRLPAVAYAALENLKQANLRVVPVTGRPAGWCDMIARLWPVEGVVGENGAFYFAYEDETRTMQRVYAANPEVRATNRQQLDQLANIILNEIPGCGVSADQNYREADLAIDFCEDVAPLSRSDISRIKSIFEEHGATAKVSSIHVNGWFGKHDKLSMTRRFANEVLNLDIDRQRSHVLFCGDSPNDEPLFAHFDNAVGVANVNDFAGQMQSLPTWITRQRGGEGFAEIAEKLTAAQKQQTMRISA